MELRFIFIDGALAYRMSRNSALAGPSNFTKLDWPVLPQKPVNRR
jgi:hypothetical protein